MDGMLEAVDIVPRDMAVPVAVHGFGEHIALFFHLLEQREQRPVPAAAFGLFGNEEIGVHHLHPEADAEHGLAGFRSVLHDLKMVRIEPRPAAEHKRVTERKAVLRRIAVAAEDPDGRAAVCKNPLRIAVYK